MGQMSADLDTELLAYSVEYIGGRRWRWRAYGSGGAVVCEGVEATAAGADRAAAALFVDRSPARAGAQRVDAWFGELQRASRNLTAALLRHVSWKPLAPPVR
jgi:hypothetical protein